MSGTELRELRLTHGVPPQDVARELGMGNCRPSSGALLYGTTADGKPRRWLLSQLRRVRVILADAEETLP